MEAKRLHQNQKERRLSDLTSDCTEIKRSGDIEEGGENSTEKSDKEPPAKKKREEPR